MTISLAKEERGGGTYVIEPGEVGSIYEKDAYAGDIAAAVPGYLTQGDLMARLGQLMAVRSDTFLIRANSETAQGALGLIGVMAKRWQQPVWPPWDSGFLSRPAWSAGRAGESGIGSSSLPWSPVSF